MTYKTLFLSFYVSFCTFCASLWLTRTVFSRLLKKAISMALWTKAILCVKSSLLEQSLPRTPSWPKQNQCNLRNLRLKNSCQFVSIFFVPLCLSGISTTVERSLQISPVYMQNEPNFRKSQMNVNKVLIKDYEKKTLGEHGKNEPKTNPIKANTNPIKANIMPKQTQYEPNQTQSPARIPACFSLPQQVLGRGQGPSVSKLCRFDCCLAIVSRMIKSFLNFFGSPCVIVGKTGLTIRKDPLGISRAKTGNRVPFRN